LLDCLGYVGQVCSYAPTPHTCWITPLVTFGLVALRCGLVTFLPVAHTFTHTFIYITYIHTWIWFFIYLLLHSGWTGSLLYLLLPSCTRSLVVPGYTHALRFPAFRCPSLLLPLDYLPLTLPHYPTPFAVPQVTPYTFSSCYLLFIGYTGYIAVPSYTRYIHIYWLHLRLHLPIHIWLGSGLGYTLIPLGFWLVVLRLYLAHTLPFFLTCPLSFLPGLYSSCTWVYIHVYLYTLPHIHGFATGPLGRLGCLCHWFGCAFTTHIALAWFICVPC